MASKTARKSTPTGPAGKFQPDASASRIVPLNFGQNAYILDHNGKMAHFTVGTAAFMDALCTYANNLGVERVKRDIVTANQLAWADLSGLLDAALAPAE